MSGTEEIYFILLKECIAEKKAKTSLFSKSQSYEEVTALSGSLWYMRSNDFESMSHGRVGHHIVFTSAEQTDLSIIMDKLQDIVQLSFAEYQLLLAVTTCKDRVAVYQANGGAILHTADNLYKHWNSVKDRSLVVDVIDGKSHKELLSGILIYAGAVTGLSGFWFAVELSQKYSGDLMLTNGTFGGEVLFSCDGDRTVLVSVDKLRLTRPITLSTTMLNVGDRILWISPSDSHELGIVRWVGFLPDASNAEHTIGVEFDNPVGSGTGTYKGKVLFSTKPKHASLIPISGLIRASDFYGNEALVPHVPASNSEITVSTSDEANVVNQRVFVAEPMCSPQSEEASRSLQQTAMESRIISVSSCQLNTDLDIGSLVQVDIPGYAQHQYGVIRWMGILSDCKEKPFVGIEMEEETVAGTDGTFGQERLFSCSPKHALFVHLQRVQRDIRFQESSYLTQHTNNREFGSIDCPNIRGNLAPKLIESDTDIAKVVGSNKGIQGHQNSCYMDATLFSMFAFSLSFDSMLYRPRRPNDIEQYHCVQQVLREGIVNPLRSEPMFVRADKVMELRTLLNECSSIQGLVNEEKDPEEFLNSLLQQTLKVGYFLKLSSGQDCYFYQLFLEKDEMVSLPTTQYLLGLSFYQSDLKLVEIPHCLILQMPRFGKDYKMYRRIVPSLTLDITDILQNDPRPCFNCGHVAAVECKDCYHDVSGGGGTEKQFFCRDCHTTYHRHPKRTSHSQPRLLPVNKEFVKYIEQSGVSDLEAMPRQTMDLFAVICIQTSHYVTFVKCGKSPNAPWIFFDSMADRIGQAHGYNVPKVELCTELPAYIQPGNHAEILKMADDKELPEQMRRLLCDGYICMYQTVDLAKYR